MTANPLWSTTPMAEGTVSNAAQSRFKSEVDYMVTTSGNVPGKKTKQAKTGVPFPDTKKK